MNARELKMSPAQLAAEQERQRAASRALAPPAALRPDPNTETGP